MVEAGVVELVGSMKFEHSIVLELDFILGNIRQNVLFFPGAAEVCDVTFPYKPTHFSAHQAAAMITPL